MDIKTAVRTLDLFEAFANELRPLRLSEMAALLQAPVSSCHQLLKTLERRGYVYGLQLKSYYPTQRMLRHASAIAAHDPLGTVLRPILETLRDQTGESIVLGQQSQNHVVMLEVIESSHSIRFTGYPGAIREMYCSALGKALLGQMTPTQRDLVLPEEPYEPKTAATLTQRSALDHELAAGRARGWYEVRGETVAELHAIAAPVKFAGGMLAVCVAGPVTRFEPQKEQHAEALMRAIAQIEAAAGPR